MDLQTYKEDHCDKNGCRCEETWSHFFCLPDDTGASCTQYESKLESEQVCHDRCEDCPYETANYIWEVGDTTKCWKAVTDEAKVSLR